MTPRRRRMVFVGLILLAVSAAAAFLLTALNGNVQYNIVPSDVFAGKAPKDRAFRLGGMVEQGSVVREPGSLQIQFDITDFTHEVTVRYSGVLPDLFREGQGVVVRGKLVDGATGLQPGQQLLIAEEVLAKHDENYMPPNVAESLKKSHDARRVMGTPPVTALGVSN
ncbi:MAG: cytochrome c maturation protein CcmE [Steroidobacteraceae bacterium]